MATLGASVSVKGEISSDEELTIHGSVTGPVSIRHATLTLGERANLRGDIRGVRVIVQGTVHGSITASERIELGPSAVVTGALSANQVVLADRATFHGTIDMDRRTIAARVAQYKSQRA
jgi:cytoskeletal protein CcmA (bactofilin family)